MSHDPLCPANGERDWIDVDECGPCDFIRAIRADERERIADMLQAFADEPPTGDLASSPRFVLTMAARVVAKARADERAYVMEELAQRKDWSER